MTRSIKNLFFTICHSIFIKIAFQAYDKIRIYASWKRYRYHLAMKIYWLNIDSIKLARRKVFDAVGKMAREDTTVKFSQDVEFHVWSK